MVWDIKADVFKFLYIEDEKPDVVFSQSLFDPLGFLAPVTIKEKRLLKNCMSNGLNWDDSTSRLY